MAYNITDLINKARDITIKRKAIYENIGHKNSSVPTINILSKVLVKELDKTLDYYDKLEKEVKDKIFEEIDFSTYDKMSFLVNEFSKKLYTPEINSTRQFLEFYLSREKDLYSLLIDIQGRFVKNTDDVHTRTYKILSDMIKIKSEHIKTIEKTLK